MSANPQAKKRQRRAYLAFSLAALSCLLGLVFCVVKSPQSKSETYLAMAVASLAQDNTHGAVAAAMEAVRLNPAAPEGWLLLSKMLEENEQQHAAQQALAIAARLKHNPAPQSPVYAMPAELRLSFLSFSGADIP